MFLLITTPWVPNRPKLYPSEQKAGKRRRWQWSTKRILLNLPCDIEGAKEPGMMYFPTK